MFPNRRKRHQHRKRATTVSPVRRSFYVSSDPVKNTVKDPYRVSVGGHDDRLRKARLSQIRNEKRDIIERGRSRFRLSDKRGLDDTYDRVYEFKSREKRPERRRLNLENVSYDNESEL